MKNRAEKVIGQGTLTNSKHWSSYVEGVYPTHIKASTGPYLIDLNNKKYLDFICGLGTNLLGYGFPLVENEVEVYRNQGKSPSLPHVIEVELAEQLKQVFPWVQKWKFLKTGSEATCAAVRMARAYTKKDLVYSDGYHGWADMFTALTPPANGVPPHMHMEKLQADSIDEYTGGVIIEPVITEDGEERISYLQALREECTRKGAVLIFDEIITGFRYKQHSVSKAYNIRPDLICIGKSMGNGYPITAVGGPKEILDSDYFVSSTFAGEIGSMAAAKAVAKIIRENPNYNIDRLWEAGTEFLTGFNEHAAALNIKIEGYATRGVFKGDERNIALFFQEACKAGLLFGKSWFISHAHIPMLKNALFSCQDILLKMQKKLPRLEGKMPRSPLAARVREK